MKTETMTRGRRAASGLAVRVAGFMWLGMVGIGAGFGAGLMGSTAQAQPTLAEGEAAWALLQAAGGAPGDARRPSAPGAAPQPAATAVLFRHANAPGFGDPPGFRLDDCRTQRNLDDTGREQARRIGRAFGARGLRVGAVWSSPWCRVRETADLAFPGRTVVQPAFGSFFGEREAEPRHTREAQAALSAWTGPGLLVVFTHQVNITALAGIHPASGEGVVMVRAGDTWRPVARLTP